MINHWVFRCKDITALISQSMDAELPFKIRLGIRFHLMMCRLCLRYKKQLELVAAALAEFDTDTHETVHFHLSDEIKHEMKNTLNIHY